MIEEFKLIFHNQSLNFFKGTDMEHQPITNQSFKMIREGNFSLNHILLEKILSPTMNSSSMNHNLKTEILIKDTTKVDKDRDIVNDHSMIERMRGEVIRIIKNRKKEKDLTHTKKDSKIIEKDIDKVDLVLDPITRKKISQKNIRNIMIALLGDNLFHTIIFL